MLTLLFAVTTFAQTELPQITTDLENPIYYTIYNTRSQQPGGLMYYAGDGVGIKDGCTSAVLEDKYKFYFTGSHDALYVHNAATTNKLASVSSWTTDGIVWCVKQREDGYLAFGPQGAADDAQAWWNDKNYSTDAATSDFTVWYSYDDGSGFVTEPVGNYTFPETDKFYTIECPLFEKVQGVAKGLVAGSDGSLKWNTVDLTDKNFYWVPTVNNDGTVALKNLGTGLYINGDAVAETGTATLYALGASQFKIVSNGTTIHANGHGGGANASGGIVSYEGAAGSASAWSFVERRDPDAVQEVKVTYNFVYNGETKYSQTYNTLVGEQYQTITVTHPLGVSVVTAAPTGEILAEDIVVVDGVNTITKELELTISNMPFAFADSYANVKWQFLKFDSGNGFYLHHVVDQNYLALDVKNFNPDDDNYYWGFVGNPFDGYRIVNKGAGDGYILSSSTTMAGTTGSDTWPIMTEEASLPEGNNTLWIPTKGAVDNGFYLAQKDYSWNRMNNRGNKLAYWTGGAGTGSTFIAEDIDVALAAVVEDFKKNATHALGYVGGYSEDKADAIDAISSYSGMKEFIAANTPIALDVNKYYRIQNVYRNHVISVNPNNERVPAELSKADVNQIWKFENANTEGTYLIKGVNAEAYMQAAGASNTLNATGAEFKVYNLGDGLGQFNLKQEGSNSLMCEYAGGSIGSWTDGGVGSDMAWYLIEANDVEITLSDIAGEGWATTYLPFDVTLPEGLTAYYVNEVHDGWVNFAEAADVPAKNGVVLYTNEPKTYTLTIADATTEITGNYLRGTTVKSNIAEEAYVLSAPNNEVGFYKAKYNVSTNTENDGTAEEPAVTYEAWLNNANKAYLPAVAGSANVASYSFRFGEGTTGVEKVEIRNEKSEIYDLTGRRVETITVPGIYVVNGKKVLVK